MRNHCRAPEAFSPVSRKSETKAIRHRVFTGIARHSIDIVNTHHFEMGACNIYGHAHV
jgi:hypothetical protein